MYNLRKLSDDARAMVDLGIVLMIGIAFVGLMVVAYIIWTVKGQLTPTAPTSSSTAAYNQTYTSLNNITAGFDGAVSLLLIAITIFILAIAISALLMLRGGKN